MRILFTGGGTGGHINPALAIAGTVREKEPDAQILYVGNKGGMEERLVPAAGFEFRTITISGFQRKLSLDNIRRNAQTVVRMFTASSEAKKILKEFKPDICVGTGGYVSGPVIRIAMKMGIPCIIHEQNAYPGMTTKALAPKARRVMLAVEDAKKYLKRTDNCVLTGNPIRAEILRADRTAARKALGLDERPVILSTGGSLGARRVNEAVADLIAHSCETKKYQHIHAYGQYGRWMPDLLAEKGVDLKKNPQLDIREYINNMNECYAAADVVISRAGAISLSEIQATGKAAVLIPSPNVAENHQYHNAMALVRRDAAKIIEEKDLTGAKLCEVVDALCETPGAIETLSRNARAMAILDTNERIYQIICEVLGR